MLVVRRDGAARMSKFEVTSSPVAAMTGDAALVVGVERDDEGDLKVYLGARYRGVYVPIAAGDDADRIERAWASVSAHLWLTPVPSELCCDRKRA
jgi:hypothetical protein